MNSLLTPREVANLLSISLRTVYDHAADLGGFYPGGIRVLRFNPEVIYGYMEGQDKEGLVLQIPVPGAGVRQPGIQYPQGSRRKPGKTQRGSQRSDQANANRHGLF